MTEPDPMAYVLRDLRTRRNISQAQIADALGVAKRTIIRWEAGEQTPALTDLRRLAAYFGVSVAQLIGDTELAR